MRARGVVVAAALLAAQPATARAQCAIELVESGIQAYRNLELGASEELFRSALETNAGTHVPCATETARALMYLGAIRWISGQPDSASAAFSRAVAQAPRFRPDALEFPPDITRAFERARAGTPAVAVSMPDEVEIDVDGGEVLAARLVGSTPHEIAVSVRDASGLPIRRLHQGQVAAEGRGTEVAWDGRDSEGRPVRSGSYTFEVVSTDESSRPIRKVVIDLSVESDAPAGSASFARSEIIVPDVQPGRDRDVWGAIAAGAVGLAGGALIATVPPLIDGFPETDARWAIAGAVSVAGVIGFLKHLRGEPEEPVRTVPVPAARTRGEGREEVTLRIRVESERRIELSLEEEADPVEQWDRLLGRP
ncbi:MAG TPA: FlgD immunoglobulin-like domain containing protein [Longimicrobiales bacterium]|nr:FlgD immunoglobulin-like domain containing protein [Longimicrobiales bacterium]